jgi:colanic acid/amylovoran biosynthesis glycosyltransferase
MKLAYLMNAYPMTSTTFIPREIAALEAAGQPVARYAVRPWDGPLVDENDRHERDRTTYILVGNLAGLAAAALATLAARPRAFLRGLALAAAVWREAGEGPVRHAAYFLEAVWFARRMRADRVDHVHVHFATNAATVALLAEAMGGPGFSMTVHGPDEFTDPPRLSLARKVAAARFTAAISDHCRSQILRWSGFARADAIHVIRCGVLPEAFAPTDPPAARRLVCVGRLCPQKGQEMILAAVAALRDEMPDLEVILVGDGETRAAIEAAVRARGVEAQVTLAGWRSNAEVRDLIRGARALLLPTFAEGLPVVIMEAFALGRPVISTWIAGIPELVDARCGWLIPAGSEAALAGAMRAALTADPARLAAMGREGRARVEVRHDQRAEAGRLMALIAAAAGGGAIPASASASTPASTRASTPASASAAAPAEG